MREIDNLKAFVQEEYCEKLDCKLRFLLEKFSIETITKEIVKWLRENTMDFVDITNFAKDFYVGSDLTSQEKQAFYNGLKREEFFDLLDTFLYSDDFSICSWTIYTMGKFSKHENAAFLETVYETRYKEINPILAYLCLFELNWLKSEKIKSYLSELEEMNTIKAKLIQLYYWGSINDESKFNSMLENEELMNFIVPDETAVNYKDTVEERLFSFEIYISNLCEISKTIYVDDFDNITKNYFKIGMN